MKPIETVAIFGAGPAGLFCAYLLIQAGKKVALYDHQGGIGKKFLVAGHGGLNLTHSEDLTTFATRYGKSQDRFEKYLKSFSPEDLRAWCQELGVETFIGTSGRVFPVSMKSAEILFTWLEKLKSSSNFTLFLKHKLREVDFTQKKASILDPEGRTLEVQADAFIFALGGASWSKTGSDGHWITLFERNSIECAPFLPMNCGFEKSWSPFFIDNIDRLPLKNIGLTHGKRKVLGELMLVPYGIEGTSVYALSREIRDELIQYKRATVYLDLKPDWDEEKILQLLKKRKNKVSKSAYLKKAFKFDRAINILLKEVLKDDQYEEDHILAHSLKNLPLKLENIRPIDEAISTSGGVLWKEVSEDLELKKFPRIFITGEMLDFDAPTGGYLLQGAFATAFVAAQAIIKN